MTPTEKILKLMKNANITAAQITKELQLNHSTIDNWKSGKAKPSADALAKFADYFDVSVDYLLGRDKPEVPRNADTTYSESDMYTFPVIGAICAGYDGNSEFSETGEEISIPKHLLKTHNPDDYFVLEVKGNSMYPLFMSGDKVLIRKCDSVDSGAVAAIGYDEEDATLKKVEYVQGENWMKLIPRNPDYETKIIKGADLELCRVYGEVVYKFSDNVRF